ncbi:hypothetical protein [Croceicoccus sp. Ery5]|uniref:hypothetical protein n=1 Tax=Croceicoccus sp. Ery5 TaxID=1703340 RepID=UPI001E45802D|nr:hypothetical protein [Croceicoccus sp. Ery5]
MTSIGEPLRKQRQGRFKGAMILAMALLAITVLAAIWLAIAADAPTIVETDPETGTLVISGPEQEFVGRVDGRYQGRNVSVIGLPAYGELIENAEALAAICALRTDPTAQWSENSESLRAHLNGPELDRYCVTGP